MVVTYDIVFSAIERGLAGLGLDYHTHTAAHGSDNGVAGAVLAEFDRHHFGVTPGTTEQAFGNVVERATVPRSSLNDDPGVDADEIVVKIRVHSLLPLLWTEELTDVQVLTSRE